MFEDDDRDIASIVFTLIFIGLAGIAAWRLITQLPSVRSPSMTPNVQVQSPPPQSPLPSSSPNTIAERCQQLGIRQELFAQWMQEQTDQGADTLLDRLETLSQEVRSGMGTYRRVSYDAWLSAQSNSVSRRSLEVLADAQFVSWFPKQRGKILNPRTLGQIWYAIARDQIRSPHIKVVALNTNHLGTLNDGKGQIYQLRLQKNQTLKITVTPANDRLNLWIFSPNPQASPILKNSAKSSWVGQITQSGTYEIVITPNSAKAFDYVIQFDNAK
jgi:hypothetical protein